MNTLAQYFRSLPAQAGGAWGLPWISLSIALLSLPLSLSVTGFNFGYFDLQLIQSGQFWRLLSGHLSHTSPSHLLWDLIAFLLATAYLEYHSRSLALLTIIAGVSGVDLLLISDIASINSYAGLSGMLFAPLTVSLILFGINSGSTTGWLPLLICAGKIVWETFSGSALLSDSLWPPYPPAHIAGIAAGLTSLILLQGYLYILRQWHSVKSMLCFEIGYSGIQINHGELK